MRGTRGQTERPRAPLLQLYTGIRILHVQDRWETLKRRASGCGVTLEIPPLKLLMSNRGPLSGSGTLYGG